MKENNKIILGGGISGLIWAFYNPDYLIVTDKVGGLAIEQKNIWIHDTAETRKLLTDLGWKNPERLTKKSYIGYYSSGWISERVSPEISFKIIQKKMSTWNEPNDEQFTPESFKFSTSLATNHCNFMTILDVDILDVISKLTEQIKNRTIIDKITKITPNSVMSKDSEYLYDSLVSTIPLPLFNRLSGINEEHKSKEITNVITTTKPQEFNNKFDQVYYDDTVKFTRIGLIDSKYVIEFTGRITEKEFQELNTGLKVEKIVNIPFGRIYKIENNKPPQKNVLFLGRFAEWDYRITIEHVIKKTLDFKLLNKNK